MPTRKIDDPCRGGPRNPNPKGCLHPEHDPPARLFEPGLYEHECPSCEAKIKFRVPEILARTWTARGGEPRRWTISFSIGGDPS